MRTLKLLLKSEIPDITDMGGERGINRNHLIGELNQLAKDLRFAYFIRLFIGVVVLIFLLIIMFRVVDHPKLFAIATAGAGISLGGIITALKQVTDEMARTRVLLAITPDISLEALDEVARSIVKKI